MAGGTVFIASTREARDEAHALSNVLELEGLTPFAWTFSFVAGTASILDQIIGHARRHDFAVVVLTADDVVVSRRVKYSGPRDNLLVEAGLFIGEMGRNRVFIVAGNDTLQTIKLPTDLLGEVLQTYDDSRPASELRHALAFVGTTIRQRYEQLGSRHVVRLDKLPSSGANARRHSSRTSSLTSIPLRQSLDEVASASSTYPVAIVVGGSTKYDPTARPAREMKSYQSTHSINSIVQLAMAFAARRGSAFLGVFPDYFDELRGTALDLVVVGGGDTNVVANEFQARHEAALNVRFNAANSSDSIVLKGRSVASDPAEGFVSSVANPALDEIDISCRNLIWCAGNGAPGTVKALDALRHFFEGEDQNMDLGPSFILL